MAQLSDSRKSSMTQMEVGSFLRFTGQSKGFIQEMYNYNGCAVKIYTESSDGGASEKKTGIKLAIKTVIDK